MKFWILPTLLLLVLPVFSFAQDFSITALVGVDTTPPSVPNLLAVVPVASSQIDITWSTSTDDFFLTGYVLYRDGLPLATTTQTTFSDTGLAASTTYAYSVQAFDSVFNVSATSTTLSTTTLSIPPPPVATTTDSSRSGTFVRSTLDSFMITPGVQTAAFDLTTPLPTRIEIRWGRTNSYELGYIASEVFTRSFKTTLSELEPGTVYQYQVIGYSPRNIPTVLQTGEFTTLVSSQPAPSNVRGLRAVPEDRSVRLTWELPSEPIAYVRVVRNHLGFPGHPQDGAIVYQGAGTTYIDEAILERFSPVFYTVFTYGLDGIVSSGAVVSVALTTEGTGVVVSPEPEADPVSSEPGLDIFTDTATTTDQSATSTLVRIPTREEIQIFGAGERVTFATPDITLARGERYTISVPKSAVSTNLKTLLISFTDPQDAAVTYSYILRLNADGTAYEATVEPFFESGWSDVSLLLYDFEARISARYTKQVWIGEVERAADTVWFPDILYREPLLSLAAGSGLLILLILLYVYVVLRRRS